MITVFHLASTLKGYPAFRDIHVGTALEYAKGRIDLLRPVVVGFNATGTPTVQELPLWQAATALVFKVTHSTWFGWGNFVSLILFGTCLWPMDRLARTFLDERGAWWVLVFFLAQPLVVVMAGTASTDGFSAALMVWFLYFAERLVRTGDVKWWAPAALFACLTAVSKLPFLMAAGLCAFFLLLGQSSAAGSPAPSAQGLAGQGRRPPYFGWILLGGVGFVAAVVFVVWTKYTAYTASLAEFPYVELRMGKSADFNMHFFGDWSYRLSPFNWGKGGWRVLNCTLGSFALAALPLGGLMLKESRLARYLLAGAALTTCVFTHLVLIHYHYYLMVCPAVALLCGAAVRRFEQDLPRWAASPWFVPGAGMVLLLSAVQGLIGLKIAQQYDPYPAKICALLRQYTAPADKIILLRGEWGGRHLFCADRRGLTVQMPETLARMCSGQDLRRLQELGFTKLVMLSESPLIAALQEVNPGGSYKRFHYPESVSPEVDAWRVVFRSEDIIIKEIPPASPPSRP